MAAISPTYSFGAGVLLLETPQGEMRLRWVPEPDAQHRLSNGRWCPFCPEFRIVAPIPPSTFPDQRDALDAKRAAFMAFRGCLPKALADAVEPFQSHQWALMRLIHESSAGPDLVHANPALAYALAHNDVVRLTPTHAAAFQAVRYSHRKQRDILAWLGLPSTEAMVRLVRKIPPSVAHPGLFRRLRAENVSAEVLRQCAHCCVFNTGLIYLVTYPHLAPLISSRLLHEVSEAADEYNDAPTAALLHDIVTLSRAMGRTDTFKPFMTRRRVEQVSARLNAEYPVWAEQELIRIEIERVAAIERGERERGAAERRLAIEQQEAQKLSSHPFPVPPIPGTVDIEPLTSMAALREESRLQRNCIGTSYAYALRIVAGELYAYRVLAPSRLTLTIQKRGLGCWAISEIKGYRNAPPGVRAVAAVRRWMDVYQASL